jgi:cellulose synthase/poly-beta-1,6-N-acetylglucosamine synthase-like glycosyltransferase
MKQADTTTFPTISIILSCRNEEDHIKNCLDSILAQDFPQEKMEILVVDGMSQDATRPIIRDNYAEYPFIKVLDNPEKITPSAFNVGIKASKGRVVLIMGAHSIYESDYVSKCVTHLLESDADNVGGVCKVLPGNDTLVARAIAHALCCPFGVGNSYFRIGSPVSRYVDTVFGGCYKRDVFDTIGLFDVKLVRGQDTEFNTRLINAGGKILLVPEIISYYSARENLLKLWKMEWQYGYFKPLVIKKVGRFFTFRQVIPPAFVAALALMLSLAPMSKIFIFSFMFILGIYSMANIAFSVKISFKTDLRCMCVLPVAFAIIHFGWGSGFLKGLWDYFVLQKDRKCDLADIPITR